MTSTTLVDRLYARHAAGLPFLPISGGAEDDGAEATPPDPANPAPATAPAANPGAPAADGQPAPAKPAAHLVTVTAEEFAQSLEAKRQLAELKAEKDREVEAADDARLKALAAKGESEKAFNELKERSDKQVREAKTRADALELEILSGHRDREVSASLIGKEFLSKAAGDQVRALLEPRFEAVRDSAGKAVVRERGTGRAVAEVITEALASADFAHFVKARHGGGSGTTGADQRRPADPGKPMAFDENVVAVLAGRGQGGPSKPPYSLAMPYNPAGNGRN